MFVITPFRRSGDLMNGFFGEELFKDFFSAESASVLEMDIKADIKDMEKEFIIEAEIPGVDKKDLLLELKDNTLTITAETNKVTEEEKGSYVCRERRSGKVSRQFHVENIAADSVAADYKDGVLKIILPKLSKDESDSYQININ